MSITPTLDAEQKDVAGVGPEYRQIVLAGPGAGKSEVVGALAASLVDTHGLYPEEILVISFSRAAVSVVEQRTAEVTDAGETVEVRTIDSLAARVIDELTEEEYVFRGYDKSIGYAMKLLERSSTPDPDEAPFGHLRHVIVDEVQDVVGVRADFVLALLRHGVPSDAGFTLLGDPLQSLYDFQLDDKHALTCYDFLERVSGLFEIRTVELAGDYRSRTETAGMIGSMRRDLMQVTGARRFRKLEAACARLSPLTAIDRETVDMVERWSGSTAFLCDTNARAALTATRLSEFGVLAEMVSGGAKPALPAWIARTLEDHPTDRIDDHEFEVGASAAGCEDPELAWRHLLDLAGSRRQVDIKQLSTQLATARGRDLFRRAPVGRIVVSTVHRAKGLEFDNVVLVDPDEWFGSPDDVGRMASMLYVAMSRGRDRVTTVDGVDAGRWHHVKRPGPCGRPWVKTPWRKPDLLGVIMEPEMARALGPTDTDLSGFVGRDVGWELAAPLTDESGDEIPSWIALVDDLPVARTGGDFGRWIRSETRGHDLPELVGGRVDGIETLVGTPRGDSVGRYGLWTGARIVGPVDLEWG